MFCKNCGKELPNGAKFCGGCGAPVMSAPSAPVTPPPAAPVSQPAPGEAPTVFFAPKAEQAPKAQPQAPERSAIEEDPIAEAPRPASAFQRPGPAPQPSAPSAPAAAPAGPGQSEGKDTKRRGKSGVAIIAVGAVAAIVVVFLLIKLVGGMMGGGSKRAPAYAYLNDDYELMYLADLKEKTEPIEVTSKADWSTSVQFSADGKTLYYKDSSGTLYMIAASQLKKDGRPERISRDITFFQVLDTGKVLYGEYDGTVRLNLFDGKDSFRLTKDHYDYQVSEDGKTLYYTEMDDDGTLTLYKMAMTKDASEEELLDGATTIYTPYDSSILVYGEEDSSSYEEGRSDGNTLTVWSCKPGGEPIELVSDVYGVRGVTVDGSKVDFYYTVEEVEERTLYDFVTDSKASEDETALSNEPVSPSWYNEYYPESVFFDGYHWAYIDSVGQTHMLDDAALIARFNVPVDELSTYNAQQAAYSAAQELYNAARADYDAKYDAYRQAASRNSTRGNLKNTNYDQSSFSLYHYANAEPDSPIGTDISSSYHPFNAENGVFLYQKVSSTGGKVCDVADLNYFSEIYDYLNSGSSDDEWYQNVGGTESLLDLDDAGASIYGMYILNGKEVVLDLYADEDRILAAYALGKDALTYSSTILDEDFAGLSQGKDAKGNDVLYLFLDTASDENGTVGDLVRYSGGKTETLAKEVYGAIVLEEDAVTYVISDMDRSGHAELSLLKGGDMSVVGKDMDSIPIFLDTKQILYISDGDLYLWNGKEDRRIARDVEHIWANAQVAYATYYVG